MSFATSQSGTVLLMRRLATPLIDRLDLRPPASPNPLDPDNWDWGWPAVPRCAGRRNVVDFIKPVVLMTGERVVMHVEYGPFGFTAKEPA